MGSIISTLSQSQIQSLLQAEQVRLQQPINNWQSQIRSDQTQLSAWGKVGGALSSLNSAVNAIQTPSSFNDRGATSSDQTVATATVQQGASTSSYSLANVKLAQTQSLYSGTYASGSAKLGSSSGSLVFKLASGSTETVNVKASNMTLNGVAQAINNVSGGQVSASVIGGSGSERLVLSGKQTGSSQSFSVTGKGGLSGLQYTASGGSSNTLTQARAARNATLNVNGVPVSSTTNTLKNAIPSATLTLTGSGSTNVSVNTDTSKLSSAVSSMVKKLNSAISIIQKETQFSKGSGSASSKSGPLLGNFSISNMASQLESAVSGASTSTLAVRDIGLTINNDGSVSFDASKLAAAYKSNPSGVNALVSQLYSRLHPITSAATNSSQTGVVGDQQKSLKSDIKNLKAEITQQQQSSQSQMQIYQREYSNLLGVQAHYQTVSSYLGLFSASGSSGGSSSGG